MLDQIRIQKFRCLKTVKVTLLPLTVLLGPNDSGKSAFLASIQYLLDQFRLSGLDPWRMGDIESVYASGRMGSAPIDRRGSSHTKWAQQHPKQMPRIGMFQFPSAGIRMQSRVVADTQDAPELAGDGQHVPALLDYLRRRDSKRFDDIISAVRSFVPGFETIAIAEPDAASRRVDLIIENGLYIPADTVSVGLRLMLFFVALAYHPTPPEIILLEEPENGVHPKRLEDVMKLLRDITQGAHSGHKAQVILTTHSPHLLDYVDLDTDQVLVFSRNDDGSRSAEPADAERLKNFLDEFMLGEVWYNEGEAGLVERKP